MTTSTHAGNLRAAMVVANDASEGGSMPKPELEFFPVSDIPWTPVEGAPPGHYQKILTEDPDKMFVTRMLKVDPGCASTETFVHDFWEEVYILEGCQWDGDMYLTKG